MTPEQEIKLLKELLYCTKRSCNNCGKVNCENFQRQRIDCCGLWDSYKDYIAELENKIADIKANCDLAIEGRDIKIKELEQELTVQKDQLQEEINLHLHAEDYIKSLEEENNKLLDVINGQDVKIADLEKENAELNNFIMQSKKDGISPINALIIKNLGNQLIKAKEIIKGWLGDFYSPKAFYDKRAELVEQSEQFLKEKEK